VDLTWQYVAGFFDGEGHISFGKHNLQMGITQAGNIGKCVLAEIEDYFAQSGISSHLHAKKPGSILGRKQIYMLSITRLQALALLRKLLPYLRVKKVLAQDVIRYKKLYPNMITSPLCANYRGHDRIKTHCKRGHPLTPETVYAYNGNRQCKICAYATHQRWRQKRRARK